MKYQLQLEGNGMFKNKGIGQVNTNGHVITLKMLSGRMRMPCGRNTCMFFNILRKIECIFVYNALRIVQKKGRGECNTSSLTLRL
jgi:hypothetical protein